LRTRPRLTLAARRHVHDRRSPLPHRVYEREGSEKLRDADRLWPVAGVDLDAAVGTV
jgi:hypothetical protein